MDAIALLDNLGIGIGVNPSFSKVKLEEMGIYQKYFPKMFDLILGEDEEYYIFKSMARVNKKEESFVEFAKLVDSSGMTLEDVARCYSMYIGEFGNFKEELMERLKN